MRIISRKMLREFVQRHPDSATPLDAWFRIASAARWQSLADVRQAYPHADLVVRFTVFNVKGNTYRLITVIKYAPAIIYIRKVMTHGEYDKGDRQD